MARGVAPKRQKGSKDTPPEGMRDPKRLKPVRLPANTDLSGVGLSVAQRTNPLTVIVSLKVQRRWGEFSEALTNSYQPFGYAEELLEVIGAKNRHTAVDLHSDSATQANLYINSLVEQSQTEDGHGQVGKTQIHTSDRVYRKSTLSIMWGRQRNSHPYTLQLSSS